MIQNFENTGVYGNNFNRQQRIIYCSWVPKNASVQTAKKRYQL